MKKNSFQRAVITARLSTLILFCLSLAIVLQPPGGVLSANGEASVPISHTESSESPSLPAIEGKLIPLGQTTGIKLFSKGPTLVGFSELEDTGSCPAKDCGLQTGDVLLRLNGLEITSNEALTMLLTQAENSELVFSVLRNGTEILVPVHAVYDESMHCQRIGAWVRDSVAGIGTITFVDPETGVFGALGHGICDADTGKLIAYGHGSVMASTVDRVEKSKIGTPGQLCGSFDLIRDQGWLADNNDAGIFGVLTKESLYEKSNALEVADRCELHEGKATILSNISGTEVREYAVEIVRVYEKSSDVGRDLMLRVTDQDLLSQTGGIVQGMSGSPILQDGKLAGAVTHVLVNDPTRGYGISIDSMLACAPAA